jgi:hypothetical protein
MQSMIDSNTACKLCCWYYAKNQAYPRGLASGLAKETTMQGAKLKEHDGYYDSGQDVNRLSWGASAIL